MVENKYWTLITQHPWFKQNLPWFKDLKFYFSTIDIFKIVGAMAYVDVHSERLQIYQQTGHTSIVNWDKGIFVASKYNFFSHSMR